MEMLTCSLCLVMIYISIDTNNKKKKKKWATIRGVTEVKNYEADKCSRPSRHGKFRRVVYESRFALAIRKTTKSAI